MLYKKRSKINIRIKSGYENTRIFITNIALFPLLIYYKPTELPRTNKILIINTGDLGDNILTFRFLNNLYLSKEYEGIHLLIKEQYLELYDSLAFKLELILFNKKKFKYNPLFRARFIEILRNVHYQAVLNVTPERGVVNEVLTILSGAKSLWLINKKDIYIKKYFRPGLNQLYSKRFNTRSLNEYDKLVEVSSSISLTIQDIPKEKKINNIKTSRTICIAPLSSDLKRNWSLDKYKIIIDELSKNCEIYLLGTILQNELVQRLCRNNNSINLCGKVSLNEISHILGNSDLYIGNDSGLTHLALYQDTPLIGIIGGGMYSRFFPYKENSSHRYLKHKMDCFGCEWKCIYKERYCLKYISALEVLNAAYEILNN